MPNVQPTSFPAKFHEIRFFFTQHRKKYAFQKRLKPHVLFVEYLTIVSSATFHHTSMSNFVADTDEGA